MAEVGFEVQPGLHLPSEGDLADNVASFEEDTIPSLHQAGSKFQAEAEALKRFDLLASNFKNVPDLYKLALTTHHSKLEESRRTMSTLQADIGRVDANLRKTQARQVKQLDSMRDAMTEMEKRMSNCERFASEKGGRIRRSRRSTQISLGPEETPSRTRGFSLFLKKEQAAPDMQVLPHDGSKSCSASHSPGHKFDEPATPVLAQQHASPGRMTMTIEPVTPKRPKPALKSCLSLDLSGAQSEDSTPRLDARSTSKRGIAFLPPSFASPLIVGKARQGFYLEDDDHGSEHGSQSDEDGESVDSVVVMVSDLHVRVNERLDPLESHVNDVKKDLGHVKEDIASASKTARTLQQEVKALRELVARQTTEERMQGVCWAWVKRMLPPWLHGLGGLESDTPEALATALRSASRSDEHIMLSIRAELSREIAEQTTVYRNLTQRITLLEEEVFVETPKASAPSGTDGSEHGSDSDGSSDADPKRLSFGRAARSQTQRTSEEAGEAISQNEEMEASGADLDMGRQPSMFETEQLDEPKDNVPCQSQQFESQYESQQSEEAASRTQKRRGAAGSCPLFVVGITPKRSRGEREDSKEPRAGSEDEREGSKEERQGSNTVGATGGRIQSVGFAPHTDSGLSALSSECGFPARSIDQSRTEDVLRSMDGANSGIRKASVDLNMHGSRRISLVGIVDALRLTRKNSIVGDDLRGTVGSSRARRQSKAEIMTEAMTARVHAMDEVTEESHRFVEAVQRLERTHEDRERQVEAFQARLDQFFATVGERFAALTKHMVDRMAEHDKKVTEGLELCSETCEDVTKQMAESRKEASMLSDDLRILADVACRGVQDVLQEVQEERARFHEQANIIFVRAVADKEASAEMTIAEARLFGLDSRLDCLEKQVWTWRGSAHRGHDSLRPAKAESGPSKERSDSPAQGGSSSGGRTIGGGEMRHRPSSPSRMSPVAAPRRRSAGAVRRSHTCEGLGQGPSGCGQYAGGGILVVGDDGLSRMGSPRSPSPVTESARQDSPERATMTPRKSIFEKAKDAMLDALRLADEGPREMVEQEVRGQSTTASDFTMRLQPTMPQQQQQQISQLPLLSVARPQALQVTLSPGQLDQKLQAASSMQQQHQLLPMTAREARVLMDDSAGRDLRRGRVSPEPGPPSEPEAVAVSARGSVTSVAAAESPWQTLDPARVKLPSKILREEGLLPDAGGSGARPATAGRPRPPQAQPAPRSVRKQKGDGSGTAAAPSAGVASRPSSAAQRPDRKSVV